MMPGLVSSLWIVCYEFRFSDLAIVDAHNTTCASDKLGLNRSQTKFIGPFDQFFFTLLVQRKSGVMVQAVDQVQAPIT